MPYSVGPVRFGVGVSAVTTSLGRNDPELGTLIQEGGLHYLFVYNSGGHTAPVGYGVVPDSATTGYSVTVSATTSADLCIGVVRNTPLVTGAYGWVVTKGVTSVQMHADASAAARGLLEIGGNGVFVPVSNTTGNKCPAAALTLAGIASAVSGSAFINVY
jgi:hypothetical protein